jgi:hypothetical protein
VPNNFLCEGIRDIPVSWKRGIDISCIDTDNAEKVLFVSN